MKYITALVTWTGLNLIGYLVLMAIALNEFNPNHFMINLFVGVGLILFYGLCEALMKDVVVVP